LNREDTIEFRTTPGRHRGLPLRLIDAPMFDPNVCRRRSIRLKGYDYAKDGAYFVTVCTQNKECLLGELARGTVVLNEAGKMVESVWKGLQDRFPFIELDQFVVMPNHVHGIIVLKDTGSDLRRGESCIRPMNNRNFNIPPDLGNEESFQDQDNRNKEGDHKDRPYGTHVGTLGRVTQAFKSTATREYGIGVKKEGWAPFDGRLWQRNYYEHVIRNEMDLDRIREYIANHPAGWARDEENLENEATLSSTSHSSWKRGER
jgi:putative transposase